MKYKLLSHIIDNSTPSYGNRDKVVIKTNSSIINGESANTSKCTFSNNHMGTHIDNPYHFCENGKKTYEISIKDINFDNWGSNDGAVGNVTVFAKEFFV